MTTFRSLADLYDNEWEITHWRGDSHEDKQTVVIEIKKRKEPRGKSASEIYHEGVAGHSHANWLVAGGYIEEPE